MAVKDITEKTLEAYNDVFADIVNVFMFNGKQLIAEQELEDAQSRSTQRVRRAKRAGAAGRSESATIR